MFARPHSFSLFIAAAVLLCAAFGQAFAINQDRPLPADGVLGWLQMSAMPAIVIDEQPRTLSASAQIHNRKNLIVQTSTLSGRDDVQVLYTTNNAGQIVRMWILTDAEVYRITNGIKQTTVVPMPSQQ